MAFTIVNGNPNWSVFYRGEEKKKKRSEFVLKNHSRCSVGIVPKGTGTEEGRAIRGYCDGY